MTESLLVCLPSGHPLANRQALSAADLDGESFLLYSQIGFWHDYCASLYPHSKFIVQEDRVLFEQLLATTSLAFFVSDAPSLHNAIPEGRRAISLLDTEAHATYYLLVNEGARKEALDIFDWVRAGA